MRASVLPLCSTPGTDETLIKFPVHGCLGRARMCTVVNGCFQRPVCEGLVPSTMLLGGGGAVER